LNGNLELDGIISVSTAQVGEKTLLFAASYYDGGVSVFEVSADGTLTNTDNIDDVADAATRGLNGNLELDGIESISTTQIGEKTFLFAAGFFDSGVSVFSVSTDGTLTNTDNIEYDDAATRGLNGNLEIASVTSVATARVENKTLLFAAGYYDEGVSVFEVSSDGTLTNIENLSVENRPLFLTTVRIREKTYLFLTSDGDTLYIFEVSKTGSLTYISNIVDNDILGLYDPYIIAATQLGEKNLLFVTNYNDSGLSAFELPPVSNHSFGDALDIRLGQNYSAHLKSGKANYYRINLFSGRFTLSTTGSVFSTCALYASDNTTDAIAESSNNNRCIITRSIQAAGDYFIKVTGANNKEGDYVLQPSLNDF
jgi:6-phosphogluconolactonase (cycloisomerase 2 family)